MKQLQKFLLVPFIIGILCINSYGQRIWRWDVKVLADDRSGALVGLSNPIPTTVDAQTKLTPFQKLRNGAVDKNVPRDKSEDTVYVVSAYMIGYKFEKRGDGDYHIVLQDKNTGATLVAEIPDNNIEPASMSTYSDQMGNSLESFESILRANGLKVKSSSFVGDVENPEFRIPVRVTGVGFWDLPGHEDKETGEMEGHGIGSAINGREIHPILSIEEEGVAAEVVHASVARRSSGPSNDNQPSISPTETASMTPITPEHALAYILLAAILGMAGQTIRVIVGMKKSIDNSNTPNSTSKDLFSGKQFLIGLAIASIVGGVAGVLAAVTTKNYDVAQSTYFTFLAAGYAGTDFIEGFVIKK